MNAAAKPGLLVLIAAVAVAPWLILALDAGNGLAGRLMLGLITAVAMLLIVDLVFLKVIARRILADVNRSTEEAVFSWRRIAWLLFVYASVVSVVLGLLAVATRVGSG